MATATTLRDRTIGMTILDQIGWAAKATIGYHQPRIIPNGVRFKARILPFRADGTRGTAPRIMDVEIVLNGCDLYEITVTYLNRRGTVTAHYESETGPMGDDALQLRATIHALDSDGPEPLDMDIYHRHT